VIGYDHLPETPPLAPITPKVREEALRSPFAVRRTLAALGYQETINFSFVDERWERELAGNDQPIQLLNPIASQMGVMRSSLIGSLLQVLRFNVDRKAQRVRAFEIGRVFLRDAAVRNTDTTVAGFHQPMRVAGIAWGSAHPLQWSAPDRLVDFFDIRGDVEALLAPARTVCEPASHPAMHPGRCARVQVEGKNIGYVGELHPRWRQAYGLSHAPLMFELELDAVLNRRVPVSTAVAKYQAVGRDIAVVVGEQVTHAALTEAIRAAPTQGLLRDAALFDVYRPRESGTGLVTGEKSLAVRLILNSDFGTLTETQIDSAVQAVVDELTARLGARLRS
jgi:phenylalanyl-tRNA synthetase beta chain